MKVDMIGKIKNWLSLNEKWIHIIASLFTIAALILGVYTFTSKLDKERCNNLEAEKIKINGLIQEIDYNIKLAEKLDEEIPKLINERNRTKHLSFITENMRSNLDGSISDPKFSFQLVKTYNKLVQLNNRLSFIDSPTVYLNALIYSDGLYNRSFAWENMENVLSEDIKDLQDLRSYAITYNSTIEEC